MPVPFDAAGALRLGAGLALGVASLCIVSGCSAFEPPKAYCLIPPIDGVGTSAAFGGLFSVAVDPASTALVGDESRVRRVTANGAVTTVSPMPSLAPQRPLTMFRYAPDGTGYAISENSVLVYPAAGASPRVLAGSTSAGTFDRPAGLCLDAAGNVLLADTYHHRVCRITPEGEVSTVAGTDTSASGDAQPSDGTRTTARFSFPSRVGLDTGGTLYVVDGFGGITLRRITPDGTVTTLFSAPPGDVDDRLTDLAIDRNGHVHFSRGAAVYRLDGPERAMLVATATDPTTPRVRINALDFGPDGSLYAVDYYRVLRLASGARAFAPIAGHAPSCSTR